MEYHSGSFDHAQNTFITLPLTSEIRVKNAFQRGLPQPCATAVPGSAKGQSNETSPETGATTSSRILGTASCHELEDKWKTVVVTSSDCLKTK